MAAELRDYPMQKCGICKTKDASKILVVDGKYVQATCATCGKAELKKLNG